MESPLKYFSELKDPRVERTREHVLEEIPPKDARQSQSATEARHPPTQRHLATLRKPTDSRSNRNLNYSGTTMYSNSDLVAWLIGICLGIETRCLICETMLAGNLT